MGEAYSFEKLVSIYRTAVCHIRKDSKIRRICRVNLKSQFPFWRAAKIRNKENSTWFMCMTKTKVKGIKVADIKG